MSVHLHIQLDLSQNSIMKTLAFISLLAAAGSVSVAPDGMRVPASSSGLARRGAVSTTFYQLDTGHCRPEMPRLAIPSRILMKNLNSALERLVLRLKSQSHTPAAYR